MKEKTDWLLMLEKKEKRKKKKQNGTDLNLH